MAQGYAIKGPSGVRAARARGAGYAPANLSDSEAVRISDGEQTKTMLVRDFNRNASTPGTWECEAILPIMDEQGRLLRTKT